MKQIKDWKTYFLLFFSLLIFFQLKATSNYIDNEYYFWIFTTRVIQLTILVSFFVLNLIKNNILYIYLFLLYSFVPQIVATSFVESNIEVTAYNFISIIFIICAIIYKSSFKLWFTVFVPIYLLSLIIPLQFKSNILWSSAGNAIDNFLFTFFGFILSTIIVFFLRWKHQVYSKIKLEVEGQFNAILEKEKNIILNEKERQILRITKQVAHDIRSPLAALDMAINKFKDSEVPHKELIIESAKRIHEIADDLVTRSKTSSQTGSNPTQLITTDIAKLVRSIYNEKVVQHESNSNINFSIDTKQCFVNTNPKELGRAISNIINNAVEALNEKGNISITVDYNNTDASIKITDNGKGIPSDILKKLGNEGESHGKDKGLGLGIFHAKQITEFSQGKLLIDSTEGCGTTVTLSIPLQTENSSEYILIDDDGLTRMSWEIAAKENEIDLCTFSSIQEFNKQLELINKNTTIYIDVDLPDGNGVELAKKLFNIGYINLYLATGHNPDLFNEFTFLKGIHSKGPPF